MSKPISIINLLFLYEVHGEMPAQVNLTRCSVEFFGEKRSSELITGIYGTKSKQIALENLARWNAQHAATPEQRAKGAKPAKLIMIDAQYTIDSGQANRKRGSAKFVSDSGWMNLERVSTQMRDEIKALWLKWIARSHGPGRADALTDETMLRLLSDYPEFVPKLFKEYDGLVGVLHPVRPKFGPQVVLWVATVLMEPDRFSEVEARYVPVQVQVP